MGEGLRRDKRAGTAYRARLPIDLATGQPIRRDTPTRYERERPGELIHVDIKKLGRIPDGGGWRARVGHEGLLGRVWVLRQAPH